MTQDGLSVKKLTEEQSWLQTGALLLLAFAAFSYGLNYARPVLVPFALALFLNYLVAPIVDFQMIRLKFSRFVSVAIALLLVVLVLVLMCFLLLTVVQDFASVASDQQFHNQLLRKVQPIVERGFHAIDWITGVEEAEQVDAPLPGDPPPASDTPPADTPPVEFGAAGALVEDELAETATARGSPEEDDSPEGPSLLTDMAADPLQVDADEENLLPPFATRDDPLGAEDLLLGDEQEQIDYPLPTDPSVSRPQQVISWFRWLIREFGLLVGSYLGLTLLEILGSFVLTSIFVGFMLAGRDPYRISKGIYIEIDRNVRRYIATKFFISAITGLLVWLVLEIIGLRFASMFGLLAFGLNFIPSLGSIIATLLPIPLALVQFDSAIWIWWAILVPGAIQMIMGNVIEPKIMGEGLQLHPVTVLLGLAFFGLLWGPVGMLLAAPITATIRIVLMRFETTVPIGKLMAGILPEEGESPLAP